MTSTRSFLPMRRGKLLVATIGILGLAGCATFSDDGGFGRVEQTTLERLDKDVKWARSDAERTTLQTRVGELLAKPLTADDAIQLALYNNRGLQAAFFDLGISEAELVQAGRLPNPHFSMLRARLPRQGWSIRSACRRCRRLMASRTSKRWCVNTALTFRHACSASFPTGAPSACVPSIRDSFCRPGARIAHP